MSFITADLKLIVITDESGKQFHPSCTGQRQWKVNTKDFGRITYSKNLNVPLLYIRIRLHLVVLQIKTLGCNTTNTRLNSM